MCWSWSERVNFYSQQIMILPRKTKIYATVGPRAPFQTIGPRAPFQTTGLGNIIRNMHHVFKKRLYFFIWRNTPQWSRASSFTRFLDHTQWRTTVGRIPLDEWSSRRRDLYMTTHNTHNRPTSMPPVGSEPHNLRRRAPAVLRLRPRGHWDWQKYVI